VKQFPNAVNQVFSRNREFFAGKLGHCSAANCAKLIIVHQWSSTLDTVRHKITKPENTHQNKNFACKAKLYKQGATPNK
jgi:hypothetical protein